MDRNFKKLKKIKSDLADLVEFIDLQQDELSPEIEEEILDLFNE